MRDGLFVDIGATNIRFGVCGLSKNAPEIAFETPQERREILGLLERYLLQLKSDFSIINDTILISCPGMITKDGLISKALYIDLVNVNLKQEIEHNTGFRVIIENDANVQAYGRYNGKEDLLYITIGTAVGGAFINKNGIFRGNEGFACEFGHIFVGSDEPCFCGRIGCLDSALSGRRMIERFGDTWWKRGDDKKISDFLLYSGSKMANALETLSAAFNPGEIVVCGQICNLKPFCDSVLKCLEEAMWFNGNISLESDTWKLTYQAACKFLS